MNLDTSSKVLLRVCILIILVLGAYRANKVLIQLQQTIQTYGKLGNESRQLVGQEKLFLDHALPDTVANLNGAVADLRGTVVRLGATADNVAGLAANLQETSLQATQTLATAQQGITGIATAAQDTLQSANVPLTNLSNAIGAATHAADSVTAVVSNPAIAATLANTQAITHNLAETTVTANGILADTHALTSKYSKDMLAPTPWYRKGWKYLFQGGTLYWDLMR
jgi:methyl-accepting chemotaxis protein